MNVWTKTLATVVVFSSLLIAGCGGKAADAKAKAMPKSQKQRSEETAKPEVVSIPPNAVLVAPKAQAAAPASVRATSVDKPSREASQGKASPEPASDDASAVPATTANGFDAAMSHSAAENKCGVNHGSLLALSPDSACLDGYWAQCYDGEQVLARVASCSDQASLAELPLAAQRFCAERCSADPDLKAYTADVQAAVASFSGTIIDL